MYSIYYLLLIIKQVYLAVHVSTALLNKATWWPFLVHYFAVRCHVISKMAFRWLSRTNILRSSVEVISVIVRIFAFVLLILILSSCFSSICRRMWVGGALLLQLLVLDIPSKSP